MKAVVIGLSVAATFVFGAKSFAQSDTEPVKSVISAYHAALQGLDAAKLDALWAHDDYVMVINPLDKSVSVGWDAVKKDWDGQLTPLAQLTIQQSAGPFIHVQGDTAWSTGVVEDSFKLKSGFAATSQTFETDVFERRAGGWLLVSHTALDVSPHAR